MKYILQGIGDYIKDWWHDWLLDRLQATYPNTTIHLCDQGYNAYYKAHCWKEGNLWHYIQQRRIANKVKKAKGKK